MKGKEFEDPLDVLLSFEGWFSWTLTAVAVRVYLSDPNKNFGKCVGIRMPYQPRLFPREVKYRIIYILGRLQFYIIQKETEVQ